VLGTVGQHDRDGVAFADAALSETRRDAIDRLDEVAIRGRATEELQRGRIRVVTRRRRDDVQERAGDRFEIIGDPGGVAAIHGRGGS
jgi:hypothetical protein